MAISKITTGSISDSVAIDTDTLVVDGANNRVGVGTASPTKKLSASIGLSDTDGLALEYSGENKAGILLNPTTGEVRMGALNATGTYFTTLYSNNTERMRIDSSGRVTMPAQPAFTALFSGNNNNTSTLAGGGGDIPFNYTYFNIGSHFSTSTGRFTAPIYGIYQFSACAFLYDQGQLPSSTSGTLALKVNGSIIHNLAYAFFGNSSSYPPMSGTALVALNAGDYVNLYTNYGVYTDASNSYLHFSGCLIG